MCAGALLLLTQPAFAGTGSSGGGASILCKNSVELYDLYEAKIRKNYNYSVAQSYKDTEKLVSDTLAKIPSYSQQTFLKKIYSDIKSRIQMLPTGVLINAPSDLGNQVGIVVPSGCSLQATGYFESNGTLLVSSDLYGKMDVLNQAAFLLHETIYYAARITSNAQDSYTTRFLTSTLFDDNETNFAPIANSVLFKNPAKKTLNIASIKKIDLSKLKFKSNYNFAKYSMMFFQCYDSELESVFFRRFDAIDYITEIDISECTYIQASIQEYIGSNPNFIDPVNDYKTNFDWFLTTSNGIFFKATVDFSNYIKGNENLILLEKN